MTRSAARILDEYLAASARAGDRDAFARLAVRWHPKLLMHAYRLMGDMEFARDVAQESWGDIAKSLPGLRDSALFPAWSYRIVTRRAADAIKRLQRERKTNAAYAAEPSNNVSTTTSMEASADSGPLNIAIADLPPQQRAAIALHYKEGLSIAEISAALEVPMGTVKTRLMHARRKLRDALEGGRSHE